MVAPDGFAPSRPCGHQILRLAGLLFPQEAILVQDCGAFTRPKRPHAVRAILHYLSHNGAPNQNCTDVFRFAGERLGFSAIGAYLVAPAGFEPATPRSSAECSTTELQSHMVRVIGFEPTISRVQGGRKLQAFPHRDNLVRVEGFAPSTSRTQTVRSAD